MKKKHNYKIVMFSTEALNYTSGKEIFKTFKKLNGYTIISSCIKPNQQHIGDLIEIMLEKK